MKEIIWEGKQIENPGLYSKIGLDTYHRADICVGPSVSSSGLRTLYAKSPAHFYQEWPGNDAYVEPADKAAWTLGRAAHHLFLGEEYFSALFAAQPLEYPDTKTGELKSWHNGANFCKDWRLAREAEGKLILTPAMIESIKGMAESLSKHPIIKAGALNGRIERSIFWQDEATGLWLKSRPDAIPTSDVDFCDLKTTTSVLWQDLQSTIADYGYHAQGALIRTAAREVLKIKNPTFTLIFVEKTAPFCVRVVTLKDNDLDRGEKQNRAALDTIARCIASGHWPGPGGEREDAENIELPGWAQKQIDDRLQYGIST